ncbi:hypothetical protein F5877DRAFT_84471 [Lentinula edodes]|nr:hypothetical protein F5877DRAFT_84471 [Lentinula edodes]
MIRAVARADGRGGGMFVLPATVDKSGGPSRHFGRGSEGRAVSTRRAFFSSGFISVAFASGPSRQVPLPSEDALVPLPSEDALVPLPSEDALVPLPSEDALVPLPSEDALVPPPSFFSLPSDATSRLQVSPVEDVPPQLCAPFLPLRL